MSFESSQTRVFLQQYLLNQLVTSRNVYVKRKVLKLIEELLEKGHIEFKQNLRKQPEPLNEAAREEREGEGEGEWEEEEEEKKKVEEEGEREEVGGEDDRGDGGK